MASFDELLRASADQLVSLFAHIQFAPEIDSATRIGQVAVEFDIHTTELICGLGFNPASEYADTVLGALGFSSYEALANRRNYLFASDIYRRLGIHQIQQIYATIKNSSRIIEALGDVLISRLEHIEENIDGSISSRVIDAYKLEVRVIYAEGIGQIAFAEHRISDAENGFRALTNELSLIVENKVLPAGDLFFRNSVLPAEKRKLIKSGSIPHDMIIARLSDPDISVKERRVLKEFI